MKGIYDDDDITRNSLILKVCKDDNIFICNRNSDDYKSVFRDKYVKWWETHDLSHLNMNDNGVSLEIIEVVDVSNYNLNDQKLLNEIKKKYINEYEALEDEDRTICNLALRDSKYSYRQFYRDQYRKFKEAYWNIYNMTDKLYDYGKKLFYKKNNEWFFEMSRWEIWNDKRFTDEQKVLLIILRDYIADRKEKNYKYPFTIGYVKHTLRRLKNIKMMK